MDEKSYTYLLRCADGSLYCGWTRDLVARERAHNAGKGAKYTRSRLPVQMVYREEYPTEHEARSREWHIKKLTKAEKERLVAEGCPSLSDEGQNDGRKE